MEQAKGSDDVGRDELLGADDGAVNVAFGSKVHQGVRLMLLEQGLDECGVFDAALHEDVIGMSVDGGKIAKVSGVGEFIEVDHAVAGCNTL